MKILFSLTYYTPYISGLTIYVKRLAEALNMRGYRVTTISTQYDKKLSTSERINGVNVERCKYIFHISKGFLSFDWLVKTYIHVKINDIVLIALPQFEGIFPSIWAKIIGKKIVAVYLSEVKLPYTLTNYIAEKVLHLANLLTLHLANKIVTYNDDFASHTKILPYFQKKTVYINPPIVVPNINKRARKLLIEKIGGEEQINIGFVGRLASEKGIEYLLAAIPQIESGIKNYELRIKKLNKIPKFKIVIAGPSEPIGEEDYQKKIALLVEKYKEYVVFLGELKEDEMGAFYSLLDILVLPSVNSTEAFGMVQVEAMMLGVPVVVSDLPGVRVPVVKTGMGKITPICNSKLLAQTILDVWQNKNNYVTKKDNVINEYSFDNTIYYYHLLIQNIF